MNTSSNGLGLPTGFEQSDPIDVPLIAGIEATNTTAPVIVTQAGPLQASMPYATKGSGGSRRDLAASLGTIGSFGTSGGSSGGGTLGGGLLGGGLLANAIALAAAAPNTLSSLGFMGDSGGTVNVTGLLVNPGTLLLTPGPGYAALNLTGTIQGGTVVPQPTMGLVLNGGTLSSLTWAGPLSLRNETVTLNNVTTGPVTLLDSTLIEGGTVGSLGTIVLEGVADALQFDHLGGASATLSGWQAGDRIVLPAGSGYALGWNAGTLDILQNGSQMAAFVMSGSHDPADFQIDAAGGTVAIDTPIVAWTNPSGGNWSAGTNWSTSPVVPGIGAFAAIALAGTYAVNLDVPLALDWLQLNDPGLTVNDNLGFVAPYGTIGVGTLDLAAGTLHLGQSANLSGTTILGRGGVLTAYEAGLNDVAIIGTLTIGPYADLYASGGLTAVQPDGVSPGTIRMVGPNAMIRFTNSETLDNMVLIDPNLQGVGVIPTGPALTLGAHATLEANTGARLYFNSIVNDGIIAVAAGSQVQIADYITGGFQNAGTITIDNGSTLTLQGYYATTSLGTIKNTGGTITIGTLDNTGATLAMDSTGRVILPGSMPVQYINEIDNGTIVGSSASQIQVTTLSGVTWFGSIGLAGKTVYLQHGTHFQTSSGGADSIAMNNSVLQVDMDTTLDAMTINATSGSNSISGQDYALPPTYTYPTSWTAFGPQATVNVIGPGTKLTLTLAPIYIPIVNQGTIRVSGPGADLLIGSTAFQNSGVIAISNGGSLELGSGSATYSPFGLGGTGSIVLADSTSSLLLDAKVDASLLGGIAAHGGILQVAGTLDNTGGTLLIGSASGFGTLRLGTVGGLWTSPSGTIRGGTIVNTGTFIASGGALDGVRWQGGMTLAGTADLKILNGLSIQSIGGGRGTLDLAGANLQIRDPEAIDNIALVGYGYIVNTTSLTLGTAASIVSQGLMWLNTQDLVNNGSMSAAGTSSEILITGADFVNTGSIGVVGTGNSLVIQATTFANPGTISITSGGSLWLNALANYGGNYGLPIGFVNNGVISVDAASTLTVSGTITPTQLDSLQLSGGVLNLQNRLDNTGNTLTLAAGGRYGDLAFNAAIIEGGTIVNQGATPKFYSAVLDNVTWQGSIDLNGSDESVTFVDAYAVLPSAGQTQTRIDLTGDHSSIGFGAGTLSNSLIKLDVVGGSVSLNGPAPPGFVVVSQPPGILSSVLTLANTTTLIATTQGARTISVGGSIVNQGLIENTAGNFRLGNFSPLPQPPITGTGVIITLITGIGSSTPVMFDNQGTIYAGAGTGSTFTVGDLTNFSNEGLIQVTNGDDLIAQTSTFANTGTMAIYAGSTMEFAGTVGAVGTISFATPDGTLQFDQLGSVAATVNHWQASDRILLPTGTGYALALNAGTLEVLQNGNQVAAFAVGAGYAASDFQIDTAGGLVAIDTPAGPSNQPMTIGAGTTTVMHSTVGLGGNGGTSSLAIIAGGTLIADALDQGVGTLGTGDAVVSGLGSSLRIGGPIIVGDTSAAELTIVAGATATAGRAVIGNNVGSAGAVDVEGAGSLLHITGQLTIGASGSATLILGQGGTVTADGGYTIGAGGSVIQNGGTLDPPGLSINHGTMGGIGTADGNIENDGTISASGGTYEVNGAVTGQGGILTIADRATMRLDQAVGSGQTVAFSGASGTLSIRDLADFDATIANFQASDIIQATAAAPGIYDNAARALIFSSGASIRFATPLDGASVAALAAIGLAEPPPLLVAMGTTAVAIAGPAGWTDIGLDHAPLLLPTG